MKIVRLMLFMVLMPVACGHLPEIRTVDDSTTAGRTAACADIFPRGQWQLVHAIEIFPPAGSKQTVLGIIQISSEQRTFRCVLMTIEGLVLFEADFDGAVTIQRAIPPLDKPGMAEGMLQDISLLFLHPNSPALPRAFRKRRRGSAATRPPIKATRTSSCSPTAFGKSAVTAKTTVCLAASRPLPRRISMPTGCPPEWHSRPMVSGATS